MFFFNRLQKKEEAINSSECFFFFFCVCVCEALPQDKKKNKINNKLTHENEKNIW